ncbi:MAG: hypothetical protein RSD57_13530 [Comamonas sp.]
MTYRTSTYTSRELRRLQAKRQRTTSQPRRIPKGTGQEGIARLNDCLPYDPGDTTADHIKTREAFARVADGTASKDDFDRVVVALNLARIRAGQIDQGLCDEVGTAQAALERCKQRYLATGKFGFDGPGLQAMLTGLDHHEAIMDASSPRQMELALQQMRRNLQRMHSQPKSSH